MAIVAAIGKLNSEKTTEILNQKSVLDWLSKPGIEHQGQIMQCLTDRENEILELLRQQHTYANIAERCFISVPTVRKHVKSICEKYSLDSTDRHALCLRLAFIEIGELTRRVDSSDERLDALFESIRITSKNVDSLADSTQRLIDSLSN